MTEHCLGKLHHSVVVGICLIEFHKRKFGVMSCVNAFVTENSADFVNSFKTAYYQSLKIKLERNTKLYVLVKSVVMRFERSCRRAARVIDKHRSFDLHKTALIEELSDFGKNHRALDEGFLDLGIDNQIKVSLTVTDVRILKPVELLGKRNKRF